MQPPSIAMKVDAVIQGPRMPPSLDVLKSPRWDQLTHISYCCCQSNNLFLEYPACLSCNSSQNVCGCFHNEQHCAKTDMYAGCRGVEMQYCCASASTCPPDENMPMGFGCFGLGMIPEIKLTGDVLPHSNIDFKKDVCCRQDCCCHHCGWYSPSSHDYCGFMLSYQSHSEACCCSTVKIVSCGGKPERRGENKGDGACIYSNVQQGCCHQMVSFPGTPGAPFNISCFGLKCCGQNPPDDSRG